jgi:hypothetical protein
MLASDWSASNLENVLRANLQSGASEHDLNVLVADNEFNLFAGVTKSKMIFFSGPHINAIPSFNYPIAKLVSNQSFELPGGNFVGPMFVLSCSIETEEEIWSISSLLSGLHNVRANSVSNDSLEASIIGLDRYFEENINEGNNSSVEIGLFGELVVIYGSTNPDLLVNAWHPSRFSTYDFGLSSNQIEVKTSTRPDRIHSLRESQTSEGFTHEILYCSVYAPTVADGISITDLSVLIQNRLQSIEKNVFLVKLNQYNIDNFNQKFNVNVALQNVIWVSGDKVPRPLLNDTRIRDCNWKTSFLGIEQTVPPVEWAS